MLLLFDVTFGRVIVVVDLVVELLGLLELLEGALVPRLGFLQQLFAVNKFGKVFVFVVDALGKIKTKFIIISISLKIFFMKQRRAFDYSFSFLFERSDELIQLEYDALFNVFGHQLVLTCNVF